MTAELALAPSQRAICRLGGVSDGEAAAGARAPTVVLGRATTSLRRLCVTRLRRAQLHQITLDPWGDLVGGRHHELVAAVLRWLVIAPLSAWPVARLPATGRRER